MRNTFLNLNFLSWVVSWVSPGGQTTAASRACTLIEAALPGKVFYPGKCPILPHCVPHIIIHKSRNENIRGGYRSLPSFRRAKLKVRGQPILR